MICYKMTAADSKIKQKEAPLTFKPDVAYRHRKKKVSVPAVNIDETDHEYIVMLAAPGFSKEALQIKIEKNILSVEASKKPDNIEYIHDCCEYDYRRWKRFFPLPENADALMTRACYINGELIITIPKGKNDSSIFIHSVYVY
jgi:HSP20 family molecular chaperone IbpA